MREQSVSEYRPVLLRFVYQPHSVHHSSSFTLIIVLWSGLAWPYMAAAVPQLFMLVLRKEQESYLYCLIFCNVTYFFVFQISINIAC